MFNPVVIIFLDFHSRCSKIIDDSFHPLYVGFGNRGSIFSIQFQRCFVFVVVIMRKRIFRNDNKPENGRNETSLAFERGERFVEERFWVPLMIALVDVLVVVGFCLLTMILNFFEDVSDDDGRRVEMLTVKNLSEGHLVFVFFVFLRDELFCFCFV